MMGGVTRGGERWMQSHGRIAIIAMIANIAAVAPPRHRKTLAAADRCLRGIFSFIKLFWMKNEMICHLTHRVMDVRR